MKKPKRTPAERAAQEAAEKRATLLRDIRKQGAAVRFTFYRVIRNALNCSQEEAERELARMIAAGELRKVEGRSELQVPFYVAKSF